jgi:3'-phosphoadenosine 5'-phosphosulfate sulfotransferase (PAPS reductase)/FAD synthetase
MSARIVCQFSCGAASAVTTKLMLAQYPDALIINAFLKNEHPDNRRFAHDCEKWFGKPLTVLRDEKYGADTITVFRRRQFIKGPHGAACSTVLKRELLRQFEQPGDVIVLGYTAEEQDRLDDFRDQWPDRPCLAPLIDKGLTKEDCKAMVQRAGIRLPFMYEQGYENANCIGCVKGGEGYFRAIREDYPVEFEALAQVEEEIGPSAYILRYRSGSLKDQRFPLRDLPAGPAVRNEVLPSCSFFCEMAEQEYTA